MVIKTLKTAGFFLLMMVMTTLVTGYARGSDPFRVRPAVQWYISADTIEYNKEQQTYIARGRVVVTGKDRQVTADEIRLDQTNQVLTAEGDVTMVADEDVLTGDHLVLDLENETGKIDHGRIFIKERQLYLTGRNIEKVGRNSYRADHVSVTACDPDDPDWRITGNNLKLTVEGYGSLRRAAFWAGRLPVAYTPYFFFPVKIKRQTGFLIPEIGYSSRTGGSYLQPFFWAISDSADMTLTAHHMNRRGERLGLEYRQVFSPASKLTFMFDFLKDKKTNDQPEDAFSFGDPNLLRTNQDRYWFRMKQDQALWGGVTARLDIDIVSDQDFLREFRKDHIGYERTDDYFESQFGRDLDDYNSHTRTNRLNLHRAWGGRYSLNTTVGWVDDVVKRRWADVDTTAQRLPEMRFNALKQTLRHTPLFYQLESQYTYFYRRDGTRGHRTDVNPRSYLPLRLGNFLFLEPSAGFRETTWWIDTRDETNDEADTSLSRSLYDIRLDLSSEMYRVFSPGDQGSSRKSAALKHTLRPNIRYQYIPHVDQAHYPVFDDALDVIGEENRITYSLTNTFTLRKPRETSGSSSPSFSFSDAGFRYRQICRFKVQQHYDINEAREDDPAAWSDDLQKQPFSPVEMELAVYPSTSLWLNAQAAWHVYEDYWTYYNARTRWQHARGHRLGAEYRFLKDKRESVIVDMELALTSRLMTYFSHEQNLHDNLAIETGLGFFYQSGCWTLDVGYTDEADDRRYSFMIHLTGLGEIGSDITGRDVERVRW